MLDERHFFGDPASEIRKKRVRESAAAHAARMHGARPFPVAAAKILTLTAREDVDVTAVVHALESDASLTAHVLRVVNSAGFGLKAKVTSVRHAVAMLGRRGLREATITGAVLDLFPSDGTESRKKLHDHAVIAGALARHLASEWRLPTDEMFAAAFLHDIGKWVLLEGEREYAKIFAQHGDKFEGTLDDERGIFGFDHAELAEHLLTAWAIPKPIPHVVGLHHNPAAAFEESPGIALRVALLRLVDRLAYAYTDEEEDEVDFEAIAASDYCTYLGISAGVLKDRFAALRGVHEREDDGTSGPRKVRSASRLRAVRSISEATAALEPEMGVAAVIEQECADCDSTRIQRYCPRCDAPLCAEHAPTRGRICGACEIEFERACASAYFPTIRTGVIFTVLGLLAFTIAAFHRDARMTFLATACGLIFAACVVGLRRLGFRQHFVQPRPRIP